MGDKRPEVILLRETPLRSWMSDMSSVVGFILLIGIGVVLQSSAMQWVGALLGFTTIISKAMRLAKDNRMSIPEARAKLDAIEASQAIKQET